MARTKKDYLHINLTGWIENAVRAGAEELGISCSAFVAMKLSELLSKPVQVSPNLSNLAHPAQPSTKEAQVSPVLMGVARPELNGLVAITEGNLADLGDL